MSTETFQTVAGQASNPEYRQKVSALIMGKNDNGEMTIVLIERFDRHAAGQEVARQRQNTWFNFVGGTIEPGDRNEKGEIDFKRRLIEEIYSEVDILVTNPDRMQLAGTHYTPPNENLTTGRLEHFYILEDGAYEGKAWNKEEGKEGHLSVKAYTIPEALKLLKAEIVGQRVLDILYYKQSAYEHTANRHGQDAVYVGPHRKPEKYENNIC